MHKQAVFTVTELYTNWIVAEGDMYQVRERIETMFEAYAGFAVSLQAYVDQNTFTIALHSDSYKHCTAEQIQFLQGLGINEDDAQTTITLLGYLAISVSFSHYNE